MSGLMKIYDYKFVEAFAVESTETTATIRVGSTLPVFVTAFIMVNGEIVDFLTSSEPLLLGDLEIKVPVMYEGKPFSVFVFSSKNGYANSDIGKTVWGVWFKELKPESFVNFGDSKHPKGSVLVTVPMKGVGFQLTFTRLGDSSAGHAQVSPKYTEVT